MTANLCEFCGSELCDQDDVALTDDGFVCEACIWEELATALEWWGDEIGVERLFPRQAEIKEAA